MKIVIIGSSAFDSLESHLCDSFKVLGHTATLIDLNAVTVFSPTVRYWLSRFVMTYDAGLSKQLAKETARQNPDLVVVVYRHLHPAIVTELKAKLPGRLVIQINPDTIATLERQQIIASEFDYYFSKEPYLVEVLRDKAQLNAHYLPEGFNPRVNVRPIISKAQAEAETDIDVLIYGNLYPYRARMAQALLKANIRVAIYGRPAAYTPPIVRQAFRNRYLAGEEKNQLLYGAKIVFNNFFFAEITSANQKYFEINGTGGFQLCDYKPLLNGYSGVPCEQVTYESTDEAIDKIRYYLSNPEARHAIADQQYRHFQQHHTFDQRMAYVLKTIGL
jgi:spore maturation protein CgeB